MDCDSVQANCWDGTVPTINEFYQIEAPEVLFVTHAANTYDTKATINGPVNQHVSEFKKGNVPIVYLVDPGSAKDHSRYYLKHRPTYVAVSTGGEHQIEVNANKIYIAGGFFEVCAAATVRDLILYAKPKSGRVRIEFLADSIYSYDNGGLPLKGSIDRLTDEEFVEFLKQGYLQDGSIGSGGALGRGATFGDYTFDIFRDGRKVASLGHGPKSVSLDFIDR